MYRFLLSTISFVLLSSTLAFSSKEKNSVNNLDDGYDFISDISFPKELSFAPETLTTEQFKKFKTEKEIKHGLYTIKLVDQESFKKQLPSLLRIFSGWDDQISKRINKKESSCELQDEKFITETYIYKDKYSSESTFDVTVNVPFYSDLSKFNLRADKIIYVDICSSPLREKDFFNDKDAVPYSYKYNYKSLVQLMLKSFFDDSISRGEYRFNTTTQNLLLLIAQQEGENVFNMTVGGRLVRGKELYDAFLRNYHLTYMGPKHSFGMDNYRIIIRDLIEILSKKLGFSFKSAPSFFDIEREIAEISKNMTDKNFTFLVPFKKIQTVKTTEISSLNMMLMTRPLNSTGYDLMLKKYYSNVFCQKFPYYGKNIRPLIKNDFKKNSPLKKTLSFFVKDAFFKLENMAIGKGMDALGVKMKEDITSGQKICDYIKFGSNALGHKNITGLCVDSLNHPTKKITLLKKGLRSELGLSTIDRSTEILVGFIPGGDLGYTALKFASKFAGYEKPVYLLCKPTDILKDKENSRTDNILSATSGILRKTLKTFVPGASFMLLAGDGFATYMGEKTLTHTVFHMFGSKKDSIQAKEKYLYRNFSNKTASLFLGKFENGI